jgi:hypothetical protein
MNTQTPQQPEVAKGIAGVIVLILIFWIIYMVSCSSSDEDKPKEPAKPKFGKQEAFVHAQLAVQEKLKSPGSAEFPFDYENYVTIYDDTTYIVIAYVDSQNGFGALLRSDFNCLVTYHPKTDMVNVKVLELRNR